MSEGLFPTEEQLELLREQAELDKQILADTNARLEALKDTATVKQNFAEMDAQQVSAMAAGAEAQANIQALLARQNELRERGQQLSDIESRELRFQMDLRAEALSELGDQKKFLEAIIEEQNGLTESIKDTNDEIKNGEENIKDFNERVKEGRERADMISNVFGGLNSRLGGAITGAIQFGEGLAEAALKGETLKFLGEQLVNVFAGMVEMAGKLSETLATGVKESGLVEFESMLYANAGAANQFGLDAEKTGELLADLNGDMTGFALISADMQNKLIEQAAALDALGVSASESGKMFEELARGQGMNAEQIDQTIDGFVNLGRSIGKSTKEVVSDFNRLSDSLSQFGDESTEIFKQVMEASARLGVSADQFDKLYMSTTTFSGAADMAGKLNGVLGTTVDAMELINSESPAETMNMLRDSLLSQGKSWANLSVQQRRFLADTLGMPMGEIKKMLSGEDLPPKSPVQIQMECLAKTAMDVKKLIDVQFNKIFNSLAESGILKEIETTLRDIFAEGGVFSNFTNVVVPMVKGLGKLFTYILIPVKMIASTFSFIFDILGFIIEKFGIMTEFLEKHTGLVTIMEAVFKGIAVIVGTILVPTLVIAAAKMAILVVKSIAAAIGSIFTGLGAVPIVGVALALAGVGALYGAIAGASSAVPADDFASGPTSSSGYGDRMLLEKGSITAFNNQDQIIAGTNIDLANDATVAPVTKGGAKTEQMIPTTEPAKMGPQTEQMIPTTEPAKMGPQTEQMLPVNQEANNTTSEVGMSERVMYDKGELTTISNNETLVAGTNLQLANDAVSAAVTQRRTNDAETKTKPAEKKETTAPASQGGDRQPIILKFDEITLGQVIVRLNEKNQAIVSS